MLYVRFLYGQLPLMVMQKNSITNSASPSPTITNKRIQFHYAFLRVLIVRPVYVGHRAIPSPLGFGKSQRDYRRGGNAHVLKPGG